MPEVAKADSDVGEPGRDQTRDETFENRGVADGHQWLWENRGVRRQAGAKATSQDKSALHGGLQISPYG